jgi:hypothetical protein
MNTEEELKRLEAAIRQSDGGGIHARWEFGKYMLGLRVGKQLPPGVLGAHSKTYNVSRSELSARMKLAETYVAETELSTAVETHLTWTAIRKSLTAKPRTWEPKRDELGRLLVLLDNLDVEPFTPEERRALADKLRETSDRIAHATKTLAAA